MTEFYFSPSRVAFYPRDLRSVYEAADDGWPADCAPVKRETYKNLMLELAQGKHLYADGNGLPGAKLPDPLTASEQAAVERTWRDRQIEATDALVLRHRDELEMGPTTLASEQYKELQLYRNQLREWPEDELFPSFQGRPVQPQWLPAATEKQGTRA